MLQVSDSRSGAQAGAAWRRLAAAAADFVFELDAFGHFISVAPDTVFGWKASELRGEAAENLLAEPASLAWNPFRPHLLVRRGAVWLRAADGARVRVQMVCEPVVDGEGRMLGVRGIGVGGHAVSEGRPADAAPARTAVMLQEMLLAAQQEILTPHMLRAALSVAARTLGAAGAAIAEPWARCPVPHHVGAVHAGVLDAARTLLPSGRDDAFASCMADGAPLLLCALPRRGSAPGGLAVWRVPGMPVWTPTEQALCTAAAIVFRVLLEQLAIHQELVGGARTDFVTGFATRVHFLDDLARRVDRLDRESVPGTLMLLDLCENSLPAAGAEDREAAVVGMADLLRATFRPSDLLGRFGASRFAVWLDGADELTAAERADWLSARAPFVPSGDEAVRPSVSIGIAPRWPCNDDDLDALLARAERALAQAQESGSGAWRVLRA